MARKAAKQQTGARKPSERTVKPRSQVTVGTRGYLQRFGGRMPVEVIEDRGHIGVGGRQLLRVRPIDAPCEPDPAFEVPAEDFEPAGAR